MNLPTKLIVRFAVGLILIGATLFIPAGSLRFWQGWVFIALVFPAAIISSLYLYKNDPQLVARRLETKEKVEKQKLLIRLWRPVFFVAFLIPGFDYRFGWSRGLGGGVPVWLVVMSDVLVIGGFLFVFWVTKVNSYAARTIRVEERQTVVSTGPYSIVRHPMYAGSILMWLFIPLALGSYFALPVVAVTIPFYVVRLLNEEELLRKELRGYSEYCAHTRFRLVPLVW